MKTNYRRKRIKSKQDRKVNYRGRLGDLKKDSSRFERRIPLPSEDGDEQRPRRTFCRWDYF